MIAHEVDPVVAALGALRHTTPPALDDKLFTGWLTAPSRLHALAEWPCSSSQGK